MIRCVNCKQTIRKTSTSRHGSFEIFNCNCTKYPSFGGVIYLKRDKAARKAVELINKRKYLQAAQIIFNVSKKLFYLIYFLYFSNFFRRFGVSLTLKIFHIISHNKVWVKYFAKRESIPYFNISVSSLDYVRGKKEVVLDIGCGIGHIFPKIYERVDSRRVVGIDSSFLNLFLARTFFVKMETRLICCDVEKGLPFINDAFDFIHMADTFHYIKRKTELLKEIDRVLTSNGTLSTIHTHQSTFSNILGANPVAIKECLNQMGFKYVKVYKDSDVLLGLNVANVGILTASDAFTFFASKSFLPKRKFESSPEHFIFLSPHLDDAVLSCGNLILKLKLLKKKVSIITVFTEASSKTQTPQANRYLHGCKYKNPIKLFSDRRKEDVKANKLLGTPYKHLGFTDAAWRQTGGRPIYPNGIKQFLGIVSKKDSHLVELIHKKVLKILPQGNTCLILAPLGIGGHVDHLITKKVAEKILLPVIFWEDFPYNINNKNTGWILFKQNPKLIFNINDNWDAKLKIIKTYKSQLEFLFPNRNIPRLPERYFTSNNLKP
jgi:SAM-dependent methyltransferase